VRARQESAAGVKTYIRQGPVAARLSRKLSQRPRILLESFQRRDAYSSPSSTGHGDAADRTAKWPAVKAYYERLRAQPQRRQAVAEEFKLYQAELARHKRRRNSIVVRRMRDP